MAVHVGGAAPINAVNAVNAQTEDGAARGYGITFIFVIRTVVSVFPPLCHYYLVLCLQCVYSRPRSCTNVALDHLERDRDDQTPERGDMYVGFECVPRKNCDYAIGFAALHAFLGTYDTAGPT